MAGVPFYYLKNPWGSASAITRFGRESKIVVTARWTIRDRNDQPLAGGLFFWAGAEPQVTSTDLLWKRAESITFDFTVDYQIAFLPNWLGNGAAFGRGSYKLSQSWLVGYGPRSITLTSGGASPPEMDLEGEVVVDAGLTGTQTPIAEGKGHVGAALSLAVSKEADAVDLRLSKGPVSGSVGKVGATPPKNDSIPFNFKLKLNVVGKPVTIPAGLDRHIIEFEKEQQSDLSPAQSIRLEDQWHDKLASTAPDVYQRLRNGGVVHLHGHTSDTGSDASNLALSRKRIDSVREKLRDLFGRADGSNVRFEEHAHGESRNTQSGRVLRERRVVIEVKQADIAKISP